MYSPTNSNATPESTATALMIISNLPRIADY